MPSLTTAVRLLNALVLLMTIGGCGSGGSPTSPPTPTSAIEIQPVPGVMLVGQSLTLIANDVSTKRPVQATWSSSNPSVATVAPDGRVVAIANGPATIRADFPPASAAVTLRIAPDFRGSWRGVHRLAGCGRDATFGIVDFCQTAAANPQQSLAVDLGQDGLAVSGEIVMFSGSGPVTGTVDQDGALRLTGTFNVTTSGRTLSVSMTEWRSTVAGDDMAGELLTEWSGVGTGIGRLQGALDGVRRNR